MADIDRIAREGLTLDNKNSLQFAHFLTHGEALCRAVVERGEEIERLREALARVLMWPPLSTEAACEQDCEFARSALRGEEGA